MQQDPIFEPDTSLETLINTPLDGSKEQLVTLDAKRLEVELKLAEARKTLSMKKAQYLSPVIKGRTEMDRRINLAGTVKEYQYEHDYYEVMVKLLDSKIELGSSLILNK